MASDAGLDPHTVAFYVLVDGRVDSVHGSESRARDRAYTIGRTIYDDEASELAIERCGYHEERYDDELEDAIIELVDDGERIRVVAEAPHRFERANKSRNLFGL